MNPATLTQTDLNQLDRPESGNGPLATFHVVPPLNLELAPDPADTALAPVGQSVPAEPRLSSISIPPSSALSHQPAQKPRNGKVARLPKPIRDVVNRMLFNNISQQNIVDALGELGVLVTQRNISNWKTRGGYAEWRLAQEHALRLRLHQDNLLDHIRRHDASELPELGLQLAATQLSQFFLAPDAQQLLASDPKEYQRRVSMLNSISAQLRTLQKYRDDSAKDVFRNPERIRQETAGELDSVRHDYSADYSEEEDTYRSHRNELPDSAELFHLEPPRKPGIFDDLAELLTLQRQGLAAAKAQPPKFCAPAKAAGPS